MYEKVVPEGGLEFTASHTHGHARAYLDMACDQAEHGRGRVSAYIGRHTNSSALVAREVHRAPALRMR
jgi:hypothetical protein